MARQYIVPALPTPFIVNETGSNQYVAGGVIINETSGAAPPATTVQVTTGIFVLPCLLLLAIGEIFRW